MLGEDRWYRGIELSPLDVQVKISMKSTVNLMYLKIEVK